MVVVGDVVLDRDVLGRVERLCPDAPVPVVDVDSQVAGPGAAGLTALLCARSGSSVTLVAPVAHDAPGDLVRQAMADAGVRLVALEQAGPTRRKTRVRSLGQSLLRMDDGGPAAPVGPLPAEAAEAIKTAEVVLVSCYGAGVSAHEDLRSLLAARAHRRPVVWDPHPRGAPPVPGCTLVTPNLSEARAAAGMPEGFGDDVARHLLDAWSVGAVCVTAGGSGVWLATTAGEPVHVPTTPTEGDACGAGDAFAAAVATALAAGRTVSESVGEAVAEARDWVVAGGTSGFRTAPPTALPTMVAPKSSPPSASSASSAQPAESAEALVRRVREAGGTVVATGGCFDILHAGHLSCLQAARRLGDALVVLVNSDASVRRLKGAGRPVQAAQDRAQVLLGLSCVDAVAVFEEDSPSSVLARLRPDLWVKGGDYEGAELPEAAQVRGWGGRVVLLPYLSGYSTTAILAEVE